MGIPCSLHEAHKKLTQNKLSCGIKTAFENIPHPTGMFEFQIVKTFKIVLKKTAWHDHSKYWSKFQFQMVMVTIWTYIEICRQSFVCPVNHSKSHFSKLRAERESSPADNKNVKIVIRFWQVAWSPVSSLTSLDTQRRFSVLVLFYSSPAALTCYCKVHQRKTSRFKIKRLFCQQSYKS